MGVGAKESFRVLLRQLIGGLLLIGGLYGVMKLVTNGNYYFAGFELIRMVIYVFFVSLMLFSAYTGYRLIKNIDSAYTHAKLIYISQIPIISVVELFRWHWTSGISFNIFVKFSENGDPFTSFRFSLGSGYSSNVEETFFAVNLIALFIAVILIYLQKNKNNSKEQYAQLDSVKDTNKIYHKLRIIGLGGLILSVLGGTAFYFYTHLFTKTVSANPIIKDYQPVEEAKSTLTEEEIHFKGLTYKVVTSPITRKKWLDRNLGASQACTASSDEKCYGDYYQWGRLADGHEKADSAITEILASNINNAGREFIVSYFDWLSLDDNSIVIDGDGEMRSRRWSVSDGSGVCPAGFAVPTIQELEEETTDYSGANNLNTGAVKVINSTTAFENFLKLPVAGYRESDKNLSSIIAGIDIVGGVWSSSAILDKSKGIGFVDDSANSSRTDRRSLGFPVRCIKDNTQNKKTISKEEPKNQNISSNIVSINGIANDGVTGLMWQDDSSVTTIKKDWNEAKPYCENLTLGEYSDWRLPNIYEITTLVDNTKLIIDGIENMAPYDYWSSTVDASSSDNAWSVNFYFGKSAAIHKTFSLYVRCVRAGQLNFNDLSLLQKSGKLKVSQENIDKIAP